MHLDVHPLVAMVGILAVAWIVRALVDGCRRDDS